MFMWTAAVTQMNSGTGKCIYEHFLSIYENMMEDGEFFLLSFIESEKSFLSQLANWSEIPKSCSIPQLTEGSGDI